MPASPNIATKTLTGTYHNPDGTPASGSIRFLPSVEVRDVTGHVIIQKKSLSVDLDGTGSFSIVLSVTDDPDGNPVGWTWRVTQKLATVTEFDFQLLSSYSSTVDIATILPAEYVQPTFQYATAAEVNAALNEVHDIEDDLNDRMDNLETEAGVRLLDSFTTSGTWVCPTGVYVADAEIVGAGAGGGSSGTGWPNSGVGNAGGSGGGGGGAGTDRIVRGIPVTPGDSYTVTVGAGGSGGTAPPSIGLDGSAGSAGGYSQVFGYRADGGAAGGGGIAGLDGPAPAAGAGGSPSGGNGGSGNGVAGKLAGSFGGAAAAGGGASVLLSGNAPAGGSGGGAGSGAGGTAGSNGGQGGTGGGASSGNLAGAAGAAGGANSNQNGTAGTAGAAGNHPGNGGGGAGAGGSAGRTGGGVTGSAGAGAAGGAGYRGEVRISYGGLV